MFNLHSLYAVTILEDGHVPWKIFIILYLLLYHPMAMALINNSPIFNSLIYNMALVWDTKKRDKKVIN